MKRLCLVLGKKLVAVPIFLISRIQNKSIPYFLTFLFALLIFSSYAVYAEDYLDSIEKGIALYVNGDFDKAIYEFKQIIIELKDRPEDDARNEGLFTANLYLGLSYLAKGKESLAKESFKNAFKAAPQKTLSPEQYPPKVISLYNEVVSQSLSILTVKSNVPDAEVFVDGIKKGNAPIVIRNLLPGTHTVKVAASGQEFVKTVSLEPGRDTSIAADFQNTGSMSVMSEPPSASVYLDGKTREVPTPVKSDVDELPVIKAKPNKNAYAIVIGIEQYRQKLPKADYAVNDAKTMTEYLTKAMGYPEENVVTLTNEHAAKSDFEKYFEKWLSNNVEKDGTVFIYYSGHGAPNPKTGDAYLVPYDGDPSFIDQTGYSLKRLYESLGKLQAKEIIVALDSCFSGAGGRSVIAKGARPLVMTMETLAIPSKAAVLSAASGDQISSTYDEKGHGLFTYFMLKGIKGEGDTNGDGAIEMGELYSYIKPEVERIARKVYNNEQSPQLIAPMEKKILLME